MKRNFLFLDIDGVLNSHWSTVMEETVTKSKKLLMKSGLSEEEAENRKMFADVDAHHVWCLKFILDSVENCKVVIHSTWRKHYKLGQFKSLFSQFDILPDKIFELAPIRGLTSGKESDINMWLEENLWDRAVVIDDARLWGDNDAEKGGRCFYKINQLNGLTYHDALNIIWKFDDKFTPPTVLM